jgi:hypothetical protein
VLKQRQKRTVNIPLVILFWTVSIASKVIRHQEWVSNNRKHTSWDMSTIIKHIGLVSLYKFVILYLKRSCNSAAKWNLATLSLHTGRREFSRLTWKKKRTLRIYLHCEPTVDFSHRRMVIDYSFCKCAVRFVKSAVYVNVTIDLMNTHAQASFIRTPCFSDILCESNWYAYYGFNCTSVSNRHIGSHSIKFQFFEFEEIRAIYVSRWVVHYVRVDFAILADIIVRLLWILRTKIKREYFHMLRYAYQINICYYYMYYNSNNVDAALFLGAADWSHFPYLIFSCWKQEKNKCTIIMLYANIL